MALYREQRRFSLTARYLALVIGLILVCGLIGWGTQVQMRQAMTDQSASSIRKAVLDSAVQCYTVEGAYPSDLSYLEDHYGLVIDESRYIVTYDAFASNVEPTVQVLVRGAS